MQAVREQVLGYLFDIGAVDASYLYRRGWITEEASKILSVDKLCQIVIARHLTGQGSNIDLTDEQNNKATPQGDAVPRHAQYQ